MDQYKPTNHVDIPHETRNNMEKDKKHEIIRKQSKFYYGTDLYEERNGLESTAVHKIRLSAQEQGISIFGLTSSTDTAVSRQDSDVVRQNTKDSRHDESAAPQNQHKDNTKATHKHHEELEQVQNTREGSGLGREDGPDPQEGVNPDQSRNSMGSLDLPDHSQETHYLLHFDSNPERNEQFNKLLKKYDQRQEILADLIGIARETSSCINSIKNLENALIDPSSRSLQECQIDFNIVKGYSTKITLYQIKADEFTKLQDESDKITSNIQRNIDQTDHELRPSNEFDLLKESKQLRKDFMIFNNSFLDKTGHFHEKFDLTIQNVEKFLPEIHGYHELFKDFLKKNKKPIIEQIVRVIPKNKRNLLSIENILYNDAPHTKGFKFQLQENISEQRLMVNSRITWVISVESPNLKSPEGCTSREWTLRIMKTEQHFDPRGGSWEEDFYMDSNGEFHHWSKAIAKAYDSKHNIVEKTHIIIQPPEQYISPIDSPEHYGGYLTTYFRSHKAGKYSHTYTPRLADNPHSAV